MATKCPYKAHKADLAALVSLRRAYTQAQIAMISRRKAYTEVQEAVVSGRDPRQGLLRCIAAVVREVLLGESRV